MQATIILFGQQDVEVLRLGILDADRAGWTDRQCLTHFVSEFGSSHRDWVSGGDTLLIEPRPRCGSKCRDSTDPDFFIPLRADWERGEEGNLRGEE